MKIKSIIFILILIAGPISPVSATVIDDANAWIGNGIQAVINNANSLSLSGTQTVSCADSTTSCSMDGQIFTIRSDVQAGDQALKLVIPSGQTFTLNDRTVKTTQPVIFTLTPRTPYMTKPMVINDNEFKYFICDTFSCLFPSDKYLKAYTPYGDAVVTTRYTIQLTDKYGNTASKEVSYNFNDPTMSNTVYIQDNAGITATVIAKSQQSTGMVFDVGYIVVVPDGNGIGGYNIFDRTDFKRYLVNQYSIEQNRFDGWNRPKSWDEFLGRMKTTGLRALPVGYGSPPYSFTETSLVVNYDERHVGTSVESRFPKTMVSFVEELLFSGIPRIASMSLLPDRIKPGMGDITASVDVYNDGTTDTISVGIPSGNGFTSQTLSGNNVKLAKGEHYVFVFRIIPTTKVNVDTEYTVRAIATAQGSGKAVETSKKYTLQPEPVDCPLWNPLCKEQKQAMHVIAYRPDGTVLSNAAIIVNLQQKGTGDWMSEPLPYGTYIVSTNNQSNPELLAPHAETVVLSGGDMKVVKLSFAPVTQGPDLTWIFWLFVAIIIVAALYFSGLWRVGLSTIKTFLMNPGLWIPALYLLALIIIVFLLYGLYNSIMSFKLF